MVRLITLIKLLGGLGEFSRLILVSRTLAEMKRGPSLLRKTWLGLSSIHNKKFESGLVIILLVIQYDCNVVIKTRCVGLVCNQM